MQGALDLAVGALLAGEGVEVHGAEQLLHLAVFVLDHLVAADDVGGLEAHLAARGQAEELLGRILLEVLALDQQMLGQAQLPDAPLGMARMVLAVDEDGLVLRPVGQRDGQGIQHGHGALGVFPKIFSNTVFQEADVHHGVGLGKARPLQKVVDGGGGIAAPAQAHQGGHAGVVPAGDVAFLHQAAQVALGKHRMGEVQPGKLDLPGMGGQVAVVAHPVVQGPVDLIFQGAEGVGDALDHVLDGVGEVIHGIDAPLVPRLGVGDVQDAGRCWARPCRSWRAAPCGRFQTRRRACGGTGPGSPPRACRGRGS